VCSDFVVIAGISFQDPAQVRLAQDDDMVDALTPELQQSRMPVIGLSESR